MDIEFLPILLALLCAFLFALAVQFQHIGLSEVNARNGTAISIATAAIAYWLAAPFFLNPAHFLNPAVFIFALVGIFRPSLSANLAVSGTHYLGPTLSSTLSSTSPLFAAALGVWWLGERFTWQIAGGTFGIIFAIIILATGKRRLKSNWPLWALALPVGAAAIRSLAHVLSKFGMEDIADPYFAGLVGFSVSAVITQLAVKFRPQKTPVSWRRTGPYWFALAGLLMSGAVVSLNTALMQGQITTVVPIVAASPIFSMLLSIFIFKREPVSLRLVAALFMVVPSVVFIALSR